MRKLRHIVSILLVGVVLASCSVDNPNEQLDNEVKAIDNHLTGSLDYIIADGAGLRFVMHGFGQNPPPHAGQNVVAGYTARLFPGGTVFAEGTIDSKLDDVQPLGLRYALSFLMEGSESTVYIPSPHAFGSKGSEVFPPFNVKVPPNTTVVYDIFVDEVTKTDAELTQFKADTAAILNYLESKSIDAEMHPSGVWYDIIEEGAGDSPSPYDYIDFNYKTSLMSNESVIEESQAPAKLYVSSLIDGLKAGLPVMYEGGKAVFYIPSGLAYGPSGSGGSVPPNANLIFEISLNTVNK